MKKKPLANRASVTLALGLCSKRKTASLSLIDLAGKAGCSPQHITRIEERETNPSQALIAKLAEALGLTTGDLYMAGENELADQTLQAARERRDRAQRQRDLDSVLEVIGDFGQEDLEGLAETAQRLLK